MFNKKKIAFISVVLCVILAMGITVTAADSISNPSQNNNTSSSLNDKKDYKSMRGICKHGGAFSALSEITGISAKDLITKYPQQTAWQVAKQLGKLDALKTAFLSNQKTFLDTMVKDGRITSDESAKIYSDLQSRVAKIDGTKIVILGRPGYKPQIKGGPKGFEKTPSTSSND